jgi:hypothetical protein
MELGVGEQLTPRELQEELAVIRRGMPFLAFRDEFGHRLLFTLSRDGPSLTIGRNEGCDVGLEWDPHVSGLHAELNRLGEQWVLSDDGLSRNGTWVNGEQVNGRRRLRDGDRVRCGRTTLTFRDPNASRRSTAVAPDAQLLKPPHLSPAQRRVLDALCRPLANGHAFAAPASNQEIADELVLSVEAVKTHMRALFDRFELGSLPHNRKRLRLAELAFERGAVSVTDLRGQG